MRMQIRHYLKTVAVLLVSSSFLLSSCTRYAEKTSEEIETTLERTESYLERAPIPQSPMTLDTVVSKNDIWLGDSSVKMTQGDPLPAWLEKKDGITLILSDQMNLAELAHEITLLTGIPVRLEEIKKTDDKSSSKTKETKEAISLEYAGKLSGLLNQIATKHGVWWRYKNGTISFYSMETRVFTLYALPVETTMSASLQGASTSEGGQGAATSSLSSSANLALWANIESGLNQLIGDNGSVSTSPVTGTVTVTAPPFTIRKVAQYVRDLNEKMSRQVAISVKILQVTLNNTDQYGLDLRPVFAGAHNLTASMVSPFTLGDAASSSGTISMALVGSNSKLNTSSGIIQALSAQGKTSLVTSTTVTTLNNKVAPVQVATSENYVKETKVETTGSGADASTTLELTTDTLNYGFTMEVLPRILDHGRLILLFTMTLTDLISLESYPKNADDTNTATSDDSDDDGGEAKASESSTSVVQLPKTQTRGFVQEIAMRSGTTLVLTGFEQVQHQLETAGIGQPRMSLLGGKAYNSDKRNVLVVLLTPEVLESPLSPESRMNSY
ncbi:MAG: hypothetical protein EOM53_04840 [Alphaproteobacteria bacterium]|nr:hypothetical protein [Alphaproteobacteria bacterium]